MARYHINPKTGNPGICKAKKKCRFGDMQSEHYDSQESARTAYEKKMSIVKLEQLYKDEHNLIKPKTMGINKMIKDPIENNKIIVNNFIKKYGGNIFPPTGRQVLSSSEKKLIEQYTESAQKLFNNFLIPMGEPFGGSFLAPTKIEAQYRRMDNWSNKIEAFYPNPPSYGEFKFVGCGVEANVYLDEKENMVYKIPNSYIPNNSGVWDDEKALAKNLIFSKQKKIYENLDKDFMESNNIEYAETYFLTVCDRHGTKIPIIAQKYLDPSLYEKKQLSPRIIRQFMANGTLTDLHMDNVYFNKNTEKIVLIDCINYSQKDEDDPWRKF